MSADAGFRDLVMGKLTSLEGVTSRAMLDGYGIFIAGDMFAFIDEKALFMWIGETDGDKRYGSMTYYLVPDEVLEDNTKLLEWAGRAADIAHAASKKKPRKREAGNSRPFLVAPAGKKYMTRELLDLSKSYCDFLLGYDDEYKESEESLHKETDDEQR